MLNEWIELGADSCCIFSLKKKMERVESSYPENQLFRIYESLIARGTRGLPAGRKGRWYRVSKEAVTSELSNHTKFYYLGPSEWNFVVWS